MAEVLYYAIPFFVLLLIVEALSYRHLGEDHDLKGYGARDTRTSLTMGLGTSRSTSSGSSSSSPCTRPSTSSPRSACRPTTR
jgi:hypothetical protein